MIKRNSLNFFTAIYTPNPSTLQVMTQNSLNKFTNGPKIDCLSIRHIPVCPEFEYSDNIWLTSVVVRIFVQNSKMIPIRYPPQNQHDSLNQIQLFEIYKSVMEKSYVDSISRNST